MIVPLGRDREHAALRAAFDALPAGRGGLVIVTGEAGIGKTHLLGHLVDGLARGPRPVTSAWATAGTGPEPDRPLQAWSELGRALLRTRPSAHVSRFCGLVEHHRTTGWTPAALDEACELAGRATQEGPVLLVLDDAHRLDPRSVELLDRLVATTTDLPLLVALAGRPPATGPGSGRGTGLPEHELLSLTSLAQGLRGRPRTLSVTLGPVDPGDLALLAVRLAERSGRPVHEQVAARAARACGGNPLLLDALLRAGDDPDAWGLLDATARELLSRRVGALDTTGALAVLALLDRPATTSLLAQTTGTDHATLELALRAAASAGVVERSGRMGRYQLALPVLRDAVVAGAGPERVRAGHAAVAQALRRDGTAAGWHRPEAVRHLIAAGGDGAQVAAACLEAALWEERAGQYDAAEELANHGVDGVGEDRLVEVRLLRCLGRCHGRAGRVPAAREVLERAVTVAAACLPALEHARAVADLARVDHDFVAAPAHRVTQLEQALAAVQGAQADPPASASATDDLEPLRIVLEALLSVALYFTDLPRSRLLADRARRASLDCGVADVVVLAHDVWAFAAVGSRSADAVDAVAELWHHRADDGGENDAAAGSVSCSSIGPALVRGDRGTLDFALARLQHQRDRLPTARLRGLLQVARVTRAMLDGDVAEVERLAPPVHDSPSADVVALGAVNQLVWSFHAGRPWQPDVQTVATVLPTPALVELFVTGSLVAAAVHGSPGSLDALQAHAARRDLTPVRQDFTADVSACLVAAAGGLTGDRDLCRIALDALAGHEDEFAVVAWLVCVGPVGSYLAYAHAGLGDLDAALAACARAEAASRRIGTGPWTVHCLVQRAELLEQAGDPLAASAAARAVELAEDLGIAGLVERARRLLEGPAGPGALPDGRLREILELAALGRTNDQIARALFVSVSTVERHLSQLYRMLGVRNRAEAIARLRAERSRHADPATVDLRPAGGRTALTRPRTST